MDFHNIKGCAEEKHTHADAARAVAEGRADFGLGLEAAAAAFQLNCVFLVKESYDLVLPAADADRPPFKAVLSWLAGEPASRRLSGLAGYDTRHTGRTRWV